MSGRVLVGSLAICACLVPSTLGQDYEILVDGTNIFFDPWVLPLLDAHCFDGSTAYCIIRGKISNDPSPDGEWGSEIIRVDGIDGASPTKTRLVSNAEWKSFLGLLPDGNPDEQDQYNWATILSGNQTAVIGDYFQYLDRGRSGLDQSVTPVRTYSLDEIYRVDKDTGEMSVFVSNQEFKTLLGLVDTPGEAPNNPKFIDAVAFSPDKDMFVYEEITDSVLQIDPEGNLSVFISKDEFVTFYGYEPISMVAGGMAFDAEGRFYWSLTQSGSTGTAGGAIYRRDCDGTMVRMIGEQDIWDVTFGYYNVGFNCITVGPDNNLYFYDRKDADSILWFDVNDPNLPHPDDTLPPLPEGVINFYLEKAQLVAGPGGTYYVSFFAPRGSFLTWSTGLSEIPNDIYQKPLAGLVKSGDFSGDGVADSADALIFEACATGPEMAYNIDNLPVGCTVGADCFGVLPVDFDRDGDVDGVDFGAFQRVYTFGPPSP